MTKKAFFPCILIIAIAAFLQLYKLTTYPVGMHLDEIRAGNPALSILKTGKDFWGHPYPLYYDTFGDNRPAGIIYLTMPFVALFGLNELAVRLPSALFAILAIPAIMYLTFLLFKKEDAALASGLLLATSPWFIILGRSTSEGIIALFFCLVAFSYWIQAAESKRARALTDTAIFACLSFFFYHSPRVFVPLFLGSTIPILYAKSKLFILSIYHWLAISTVVGILVFIVPGGLGRVNQAALYHDPDLAKTISIQLQEEGPGHIFRARLFHNKAIGLATKFAQNYTGYFSGEFLFFTGGLPLRYATEHFGLLYLSTIPLMLIGLLNLWQEKKSGLVLLLWIIIAPVVAAMTWGAQPNVQRGIFVLPALVMLSALGFSKLRTWKHAFGRQTILLLFGLMLFANCAQFLHQYIYHRTGIINNERDLDNTLLAKYIAKQYKNSNKKIVIATSLTPKYEHVLFYTGFDPVVFQTLGNVRNQKMWTYESLTFYSDFCPSRSATEIGTINAVYVDFAMCKVPENFTQIDTIGYGPQETYFNVLAPNN